MAPGGGDYTTMAVIDGHVDFLNGFLTKHNDVKLTSNSLQAFENTSTNIAAAQMRNNLTNLAETVTDPEQKKASRGYTHPANKTASNGPNSCSRPRWTTSSRSSAGT
jgi:hypothetical protein